MRRFTNVAVLALVVTMLGPQTPADAAPGNDSFANAATLGVPTTVLTNTIGATLEGGEPQPCGVIAATVWYKFVAPANGYYVATTISDSSNFDTVLAAYDGGPALSTLRLLSDYWDPFNDSGCNDDRQLSKRSGVHFFASGGTTYYLQVGGWSGTQGTFQLQISYRRDSDSRSCTGTVASFHANACHILEAFQIKASGFQATWPSVTLNISQDGARSGGFIEHAIWFNNTSSNPSRFLELGDTAGSGQIEGHELQWERWWFWVDATTGYIEHGIERSPNDGVDRTYIIQWDGASQGGWGLYICTFAVCTRKGSSPWVSPTSMSNQHLATGTEVQTRLLNSNTNSALRQASGIQNRRSDTGQWNVWNYSNWQIDTGCSQYPQNFCLNGIYLSGPPPHDNWRSWKP